MLHGSAAPDWQSTRQFQEITWPSWQQALPSTYRTCLPSWAAPPWCTITMSPFAAVATGTLDGAGDFGWEENTFPETCKDTINNTFMDDAGGPGDRVRIMVTFNYETIVPFINTWWPIVPLTTWREGIVERFRTSRISGIGSQIIVVPTDTPTPTRTNTPTIRYPHADRYPYRDADHYRNPHQVEYAYQYRHQHPDAREHGYGNGHAHRDAHRYRYAHHYQDANRNGHTHRNRHSHPYRHRHPYLHSYQHSPQYPDADTDQDIDQHSHHYENAY